MLIENLKHLKDEVFERFEDTHFMAAFEPDCDECSKVMWSKGVGISFIPYELEMSGVKPSKMVAKEPANKKNINRYYYFGARLKRVEIFNAKGEVHAFESFIYEGDRVYSLKVNRHGERLWLKVIHIEQGEVLRACRVDSDSEYWAFGYDWSEGCLERILTYSSNSLPGVKIYPVFDEGELVSLCSIFGEQRIVIYDVQ